MKLSQMLKDINIKEIIGSTDMNISGIAFNSSEVKTGYVFVCIKGFKVDGHSFARDAIDRGAVAIVGEYVPEDIASNIVVVDNSRLALAKMSAAYYDYPYKKFKLIGITGTNGKTTTATMLNEILKCSGIKTGFIGTGKIISNNTVITDEKYSMTCPDPEILYPAVKRIEKDGCDIIIMEVSSHALALEKVSPIPFHMAIFTGLSREHLDFHSNMENYLKEKEKLIKKAEFCIINCDDESGYELYNKYSFKSEGVGITRITDNNALKIEDEETAGTQYVLRGNNYLSAVKINLPGEFNVYNSMLAFAAAVKMGIKPCDVKNALKTVVSVEGRCEIIKSDITVVVDYAHTPFALENLLKTFKKTVKPNRSLTLVFGCGGERDKEKRSEMASVAEKYCQKIIVTNDNPRNENEEDIINDILKGFTGKSYGVIRNREAAIRYAILSAKRQDTVIIAGKGHEKYVYDKNGYRKFEEKEIIIQAIKKREKKNNENKT